MLYNSSATHRGEQILVIVRYMVKDMQHIKWVQIMFRRTVSVAG